jgi:hypothetical protein
MMLFQAPQPSQRPDHLEWGVPQDWQTKCDADLAMARHTMEHNENSMIECSTFSTSLDRSPNWRLCDLTLAQTSHTIET